MKSYASIEDALYDPESVVKIGQTSETLPDAVLYAVAEDDNGQPRVFESIPVDFRA